MTGEEWTRGVKGGSPPDLLGYAEAAEALGVEKSRLSRWRRVGVVLAAGRRVGFPRPVLKLRATPLWCGRDIRRLRDQQLRRRGEPDVATAASSIADERAD
jgi:hypothetical protein